MALKSRWKPVEFQCWNNVKFLLQISTLKIQRWFNVESAHWVEPTCPLGVEIWLKWGWYLVDFWLNWGWYFQRLRHGWIKVDMWLMVDLRLKFSTVEIWLKHGWNEVDGWLIFGWYEVEISTLKNGWNLVEIWLIFGWFLVEKLIFGWILVDFWLRSWFLVDDCFKINDFSTKYQRWWWLRMVEAQRWINVDSTLRGWFVPTGYVLHFSYRSSLRYDNVNALSVHSFSLMEVQAPS